MSVRPATPADLPAIMRMSRAMHASGRYSRVPMDETQWGMFLAGCMASPLGSVLVGDEGRGTAGMLVTGVSNYPWSRTLMASDVVLWTDPSVRSGALARRLVAAGEQHAVGCGAAHAYLGTTQADDFTRAGRFYVTLGYEKAGEVYRKVLT